MIRRVLAAGLAVWLIGFALFAITLPQPLPLRAGQTDAVIVPTGGPGRIVRGLEAVRSGAARSLLVTGVDREVREPEFAQEFGVSDDVMECCVTLGFQAVDTTGNAREAREWIGANRVGSVRLVTTDWHMRRAANELAATLPPEVELLRDAVPSEPSLGTLFLEYHKLIYSWIAVRWTR